MRTSLNRIKAIDEYLLGRMSQEDALIFEANLLLDNDIHQDVEHQKRTYEVIRHYGRQHIKAEIIAVQKIISSAPKHQGFMQRIANLFKPQ